MPTLFNLDELESMVAEMTGITADTPVPLAPWESFTFFEETQFLSGTRAKFSDTRDRWGDRVIVDCRLGWYSDLTQRYELHKCVEHLVRLHRPKDYLQLALEYAHFDPADNAKVAFTRNRADGANGRFTTTTVGKYLTRHWPELPDHIIRDVVALHKPDRRVIVSTTPEIIQTIEEGPRSCMCHLHGTTPFGGAEVHEMRAWFKDPENCEAPDWDLHPYACYAPDLGWSIAQRWSTAGTTDGVERLDGRALLYKTPSGKSVFVRTYKRNMRSPVEGYSEADEALHTWLEAQGHVKVDGWPDGAQLRTMCNGRNSNVIRLPYLDGEERKVVMVDDTTAEITHSWPRDETFWVAESTSSWTYPHEGDGGDSGYHDDDNERECDCCGGSFHYDDLTSAGQYGNDRVCVSCLDDDYVEATVQEGFYSNTRYVHENVAVELVGREGTYIHSEFPPVWARHLFSGGWAHMHDCIEIDGEYYMLNSDELVKSIDGDYLVKADAIYLTDADGYVSDGAEYWTSAFDDATNFLTESNRDEFDALADAVVEPVKTVKPTKTKKAKKAKCSTTLEELASSTSLGTFPPVWHDDMLDSAAYRALVSEEETEL